MRIAHSQTSRSAHLATTLLVLVQLGHLVVGSHDAYVVTLLVALVLVTAAASLKLHRDNCVESRLVVSLLAALNGSGVLLAATMGLPGQVVRPWDVISLAVLGLSAAVVVLLAVDEFQRVADRQDRSSYAL
jgi:hypothetical protein